MPKPPLFLAGTAQIKKKKNAPNILVYLLYEYTHCQRVHKSSTGIAPTFPPSTPLPPYLERIPGRHVTHTIRNKKMSILRGESLFKRPEKGCPREYYP